MEFIYVGAGLVLLLIGGEALIRGAVSLAENWGVSKLVIGLTVVAFGTSAPELLVSLSAVHDGAPGIAIGNVVGSNIANILLVLGAPALIMPFVCTMNTMRSEGVAMLAATIMMIVVCWMNGLSFWAGLIFFLALCAFLYNAYVQARKSGDETLAHATEEFEDGMPKSPIKAALWIVVGLGGLVLGSELLVDGARTIAKDLGLSDAVIGVTLVAIGTSLPELATSVVAAFRRHGDVAIGNVIGSNLFNILGILGITSMVADIPVPVPMLEFDLWVMLAAAVILFPLAFFKIPVGRVVGILFLAAYGGYMYAQFTGISGMPVEQMSALIQ